MAGQLRRTLKHALAPLDAVGGPARGATILIYHRVGGGSADERDLPVGSFERQLDHLAEHRVVHLDAALDALAQGDDRPHVVLTFDDGFADVHDHAWPLLRERGLPFTLYVSTRYVGATMHWEGSTASDAGPGLSWEQLAELAGSPLCTLGNHTHGHVRPDELTVEEVDRCTAELARRLGQVPRHFAYPWGVPVPAMVPALRRRFRSAATGRVGRNLPGLDPMTLARVPVRGSDPDGFFRAKLASTLRAERTYDVVVRTAKSARGGLARV